MERQKITSMLYNSVFKRWSTTLLACAVSVFLLDTVFKTAGTSYFDRHNKGKLWQDIRGPIEAAQKKQQEEAQKQQQKEAEQNEEE
jgi:multidrug efflux pump subunit AcrB